jgi:hypothetical protein
MYRQNDGEGKGMKNRHDRRLEGDLRASRPEPRADFAQALSTSVRSRKASERTGGRFGLAVALAGLIVVAVASFGGISYASSKKQGQPSHVWIVQKGNSAAAAQYCPPDCTTTTTTTEVAPIQKTVKPKPVTPATGTEGAAAVKGQAAAPKVSSSQLPFTGLALWVPLAIGLLLVAFGLGLRTRARRRDDVAH